MKGILHARAVFVGLIVCTAPLVSGQSPSPSASQPSASATVPGPVWLQPAIDLVKYVVDRFKPKKEEKQAILGKAEAMETEAKNLEPIPKFLAASRDFRREAVSFASAINIGGMNDKAADAVWSEISPSFDRVNKAFQESYGDESAKSLFWTEAELQPVRDKCKGALADIKGTLSRASKDSEAKDKLDALRHAQPLVNDVTYAAQLPDYWIAFRALKLIQSYKAVAAEMKGSQKTAAFHPIDVPSNSRQWALIPVAYQERVPDVPPTPRSVDEPEPDFLRRLRRAVVAPVTPEPWAAALASKADPGIPLTPAVIAALLGTGLVGERLRVASLTRRLESKLYDAQANRNVDFAKALQELEPTVKRLRWPL